jgi:hypothetical protein
MARVTPAVVSETNSDAAFLSSRQSTVSRGDMA